MISIYFTAQAGTQTSAWPQNLGRREGGGSERNQRMKQSPGEGTEDNYCLSWAGKVGYWNIGKGALGSFLITQAQERVT